MNILLINWQDWLNPYAGGAEVYLYEVFSRLIKKGHRVILLCSRAPGQSRYEKLDGFEIYRLGNRQNFNFFVGSALRSILRQETIDIIIDDLNKIPFYSPFFTRKRVLPIVMHIFRSSIYRETNPLFASYVFFTERMIPFFYSGSNFVAISKSTAQDLREIGVGGRIDVVHSGIPETSELKDVPRVDNLVVYVGRVKRYKSIEHFIQALKLITRKKEVRAKIVGDGDALTYLKEFANKLGVSIEFSGYVKDREKYRIYKSARVVVQPSIKEGWGLTAIEAQACGTPVVCADSPGLREAVVHNKTGFLYAYGDIENFALRILQLIDDKRLWQNFSRAARQWAEQFSWDTAAEQIEKILYQELGYEN